MSSRRRSKPRTATSALRRRMLADGSAQFTKALGIELAIEHDRIRVEPVDISDLYAVEIDFAEDLERANLHV